MHVSTQEISDHLVRKAKKSVKDFDELPKEAQYLIKLQMAEILIWDLIMDLEMGVKVKRVKEIKK